MLPGNTADCKTLREALRKIEAQYGKAQRIWVMDRGIPTEEVLAEMRQADPPVSYLVGTPKGRLSKLEKALLGRPWQAVREGVDVKLLPQDASRSPQQEMYVLAQSHARINKERAMRRRKLKWLWARLKQIAAMEGLTREELLMKLGAARAKARAAWRLIDIEVAPEVATFSFAEQVLSQNDLGAVKRCRLHHRGLNDTYKVETSQDHTYFLRIYRADWRSREEIDTEIAFLLHLAQHKVNVSIPMSRTDVIRN